MTSKRIPIIFLAAAFVTLICAGSAVLAAWHSIQDLPQQVRLASAGATQPVAPYTFDGARIVRR